MESPPDNPDDPLIDEFVEADVDEGAAIIMAAALRLFAHKGYAATTVREIVSEADVTNPMLYYYFDSKKGVFISVMEVLFESITEQIREIVDERSDLRTTLGRIARTYFQGCREAPEVLQFIYSALFGPANSHPDFEVPRAHEDVQEMIRTAIAEAIEADQFRPRPGLAPPRLTERFMGLLDNHLMGALSLYARGEGHFEHRQSLRDYLGEDAIDEVLEMFFYGAGRLTTEEET